MIPMPDMKVTSYPGARQLIEPGMVAFFSHDTSTWWKKITAFPSWCVKHGQTPAHECTHVGILDWVRDRCVLIEATSPCVRVVPFSGLLGEAPAGQATDPYSPAEELQQDGKWHAPYDGTVYVGSFAGCHGLAAAAAWDNLLLPFDYLDLAAIRMGIPRRNTKRYICSELVADALLEGGVDLDNEANEWAYTPADLILSPKLKMLWRLR